MLFLKVMWRATGKAALKHTFAVGALATTTVSAVVGAVVGAGLAHSLGGTLELLLQWAGAGAAGGVGIGAIASFLLWDLFDDVGEAYEEAKKEVLAERVAPEHDSKGGLSAVD